MDVAGIINQHGKIAISLGIGNVATLKGDLNETGTDTTGIVSGDHPVWLFPDQKRQSCKGVPGRL